MWIVPRTYVEFAIEKMYNQWYANPGKGDSF